MNITSGINAYNSLANGSKYISLAIVNASTNASNSPQHVTEEVTQEEIKAAREAWLNGASQLPKPKSDTNPV